MHWTENSMVLSEPNWINCFCKVFLFWRLYGACVIISCYILFAYGPLIAFIVTAGWHGVFLLKDGLVWMLPCFIKLPVWHLYHLKNTITRLIEYWYIKISCLTLEINSIFKVKTLNMLCTVSFDIGILSTVWEASKQNTTRRLCRLYSHPICDLFHRYVHQSVICNNPVLIKIDMFTSTFWY